MTKFLWLGVLFLSMFPTAAFADAAADREKIQVMRKATLTRLYKEEPGAKTEVEKAEGYAVFSSGGVNVVLFSAAYGSGVVHDNKSSRDTYMKMGSGGVGFGLGVKDYRLVFVFRTRKALNQFVEHGWDLSGQADVAVKAGTEGAELSEAAAVMPGVKVYQLTESGLALQATIQGTKYWTSDALNK
jgi:lipid-binding SYLF domain-containing protein|tara:strand:- start:67597 stop:68154 length:558 start_codon:yes stop_codon:yes gene_type:complete